MYVEESCPLKANILEDKCIKTNKQNAFHKIGLFSLYLTNVDSIQPQVCSMQVSREMLFCGKPLELYK